METSTYLFINKKYKSLISSRKMEKESSESHISVDSLDGDFKKKISVKAGVTEDVDTILVPFYEKDVLVKVPKEHEWKEVKRQGRSKDRLKESHTSSYLVNKDTRKARRTTYLEMFRKQLSPQQKVEPQPDENEIRSLSPEVGDTARESISGDHRSPVTEFYNTESYNEIYYEKLLNQEMLENDMDSSYDDGLNKQSDKSPHAIVIENLKSVSEISQPNRNARRATVQPIQSVKLGGLGPDMERIKPRLERARSLQRYSEKVRMENRLRIYKKSVQVDNDKVERETAEISRNQRNSKHEIKVQKDPTASYLVNKSSQPKLSQRLNKLYTTSKSADVKTGRSRNEEIYAPRDKSPNRTNKKVEVLTSKEKRKDEKKVPETRAKSSTRNKGINTDGKPAVPPVHINFMVNVGGVRPSSALRNLEEKHRMYQEQVKSFNMENKDL